MTFPLRNFVVWHIAVPYLVQALRPLDRNLVAIRGRDQAERGLLRQRALSLPIEVHLPAELAVASGVLARHVVDGVSRAGLDGLRVLAQLHHRHQAVPLPRIGGGHQQGLAARGGERVTKRGEDHEEEENDHAEERRRYEVQEPPLPEAPLRWRQVYVTHFAKRNGSNQMSIWVSDTRIFMGKLREFSNGFLGFVAWILRLEQRELLVLHFRVQWGGEIWNEE